MIAEKIALGEYDDELDQIAQAVAHRRKSVAGAKRFTLNVGDTVTFSDTIRQKYLVGKTATVVKVNQKSVDVECPSDLTYGRFCGLKNVRCSLELIA